MSFDPTETGAHSENINDIIITFINSVIIIVVVVVIVEHASGQIMSIVLSPLKSKNCLQSKGFDVEYFIFQIAMSVFDSYFFFFNITYYSVRLHLQQMLENCCSSDLLEHVISQIHQVSKLDTCTAMIPQNIAEYVNMLLLLKASKSHTHKIICLYL